MLKLKPGEMVLDVGGGIGGGGFHMAKVCGSNIVVEFICELIFKLLNSNVKQMCKMLNSVINHILWHKACFKLLKTVNYRIL